MDASVDYSRALSRRGDYFGLLQEIQVLRYSLVSKIAFPRGVRYASIKKLIMAETFRFLGPCGD